MDNIFIFIKWTQRKSLYLQNKDKEFFLLIFINKEKINSKEIFLMRTESLNFTKKLTKNYDIIDRNEIYRKFFHVSTYFLI
jgi:hypothetical protein